MPIPSIFLPTNERHNLHLITENGRYIPSPLLWLSREDKKTNSVMRAKMFLTQPVIITILERPQLLYEYREQILLMTFHEENSTMEIYMKNVEKYF